MADITLTHTFANGESGLGTKIMQNFDDLLDVLNGALDQDNIDNEAWLNIKKMIASTKLIANLIESQAADRDLLFDISNIAGVKFQITDSDDVVLFQIEEAGTVRMGT